MSGDRGCSHWIGSDAKGHRCGEPVSLLGLCRKHYVIHLERTRKSVEKNRAMRDRKEAAWRARNVPRLPQMRVQLEQAQAEYDRRTRSAVADRAAYGGDTHQAVSRSQSRLLSDTNVIRVVELQKLIERLTADIARAEREVSA